MVLWQNPNANLRGRYAYRLGENDRNLITSDNKARLLNQAAAGSAHNERPDTNRPIQAL
jgi:hypothetical protein